MSENHGTPPNHGRESRVWLISMAAAAGCLVLSLVGFISSLPEVGWRDVLNAIYSSGALLLLHKADDGANITGWAGNLLQIAKPLAVIFVGATTWAIVMEFSGNELRRMWAAFRGKHTVICGLGGAGQNIAREFRRAGDNVVVIDQAQDDAIAASVRHTGVALLRGSATELRLLERARIRTADYLFAASEDDGANLGVALRVMEAAQKTPRKRASRLGVFVHIAEPQLRASLRRQNAFQPAGDDFRISMFNVFDTMARRLLSLQPLDYKTILPNDESTVQIVIVGFGWMGEAILVRAAMMGHYANLKRLKAVVIDRHANRKKTMLGLRYPQFDRVADVKFVESDVEEPKTLENIAARCADPKAISTVLIAFDHATRGLSVAASLAERLKGEVPVRLRVSDQSGLSTLAGSDAAAAILPRNVTVFGSLDEACAKENFSGGDLDKMARAMHENYVARQMKNNPDRPRVGNLAYWQQLTDDLIDSNRQQADHIPVKLRAIGSHVAVKGDPKELGPLVEGFTEKEVELLAKLEHRRWMAERFLAGWVHGRHKDIANRVSPYLVEWDHVPPNIQQYDRDFAEILPGVLKLVNSEVRRDRR
jgi:hypothetical protein